MPIDTEVALEQFVIRRGKHEGKQTDNSTLPAGAMKRFYCRHCCKLTETLPETFRRDPKTLCMPCEVLEMHGLIEEGMALYLKIRAFRLNVGVAGRMVTFAPWPGYRVEGTPPQVAIEQDYDERPDFSDAFWAPRMQTIVDMLTGEEGRDWEVQRVGSATENYV